MKRVTSQSFFFVSTTDMSSEEEVQSLVDWAKSNGAYINDKLSFKNVKDRGVCCIIEESLTNEDKKSLIKIPEDLIISPVYCESFAEKYLPNIQINSSNINNIYLLLLSHLKFGKDDTILQSGLNLNSKFEKYINYLPNNGKLTGNPYFWNLEEKELLDGTDAHIFMKRNFLKLLNDWKQLVSNLSINDYPLLKDELLEFEAFKMGPVGGVSVDYLLNIKEISWTSFTGYLWANSIVQSRAFPYILFNKSDNFKNIYKECGFLLPIVDLLNNHDENKSQCKWTIENNIFEFNSLDDLNSLKKGMELFNNYGTKSNLEFLLNYGFCIKNNDADSTTLTLKVDNSVVEGAKKYGVILPKDSSEEGINFTLTRKDLLPNNLIDFFSYLVKLRSEKKGFSLRMKLEGLTQLKAIIKTKLKSFKKIDVVIGGKITEFNGKNIKFYRKTQKDIFQQSMEQIEKFEKNLLTKFQPFSFKSALQKDAKFLNSFLIIWGIGKYNQFVENNILDQAVLLWIMRIANKDVYSIEDKLNFPDFIYNEFEKVKSTVTVDNEDIAEYLPLYESLFPSLCQRVPDIYDRGIWTLNYLIYASVVADRLTYKRETNSEVFFIDPSKK